MFREKTETEKGREAGDVGRAENRQDERTAELRSRTAPHRAGRQQCTRPVPSPPQTPPCCPLVLAQGSGGPRHTAASLLLPSCGVSLAHWASNPSSCPAPLQAPYVQKKLTQQEGSTTLCGRSSVPQAWSSQCGCSRFPVLSHWGHSSPCLQCPQPTGAAREGGVPRPVGFKRKKL